MFTYDPYSWKMLENPYPAYKILRDEYPAYFVEPHNFWVITRYADCLTATQDYATWSSAHGNGINDLPERLGRTLGTTDPPRHEELRRLVTKVFTPTSIARLEPLIRATTLELIDTFIQDGHCDVTGQFGGQLTASIIGYLLGLPKSDHAQLRTWIDATFHHEQEGADTMAGQELLKKMFGYVGALVKQRRLEPQDDLISGLISAEDAGAHLDDQEIVITCATLIGAAFASTNMMIGNTLVALAQHPEQRAEVRKDPTLIPGMIEEALRWDTSTQSFARHTLRDVEVAGTVIPKGSKALIVFGAGNHDERQFPDAERFDIHRKISRHLGFGWGIHVCLGAPLARLEMKVAFEELLPRLGDYHVDLEHAQQIHDPQFRGFEVLPISF